MFLSVDLHRERDDGLVLSKRVAYFQTFISIVVFEGHVFVLL